MNNLVPAIAASDIAGRAGLDFSYLTHVYEQLTEFVGQIVHIAMSERDSMHHSGLITQHISTFSDIGGQAAAAVSQCLQ